MRYFFRSLPARLVGRNGHSGWKLRRGLLAESRLRAVLEAQRVLADRTGIGFSLVVFSPREASSAGKVLQHAAAFLRKRLRLPDAVGWFADHQLAAVLPATPVAGAYCVADDVCASFPDDLLPPLCTVYYYPTEWTSEDDIDFERSRKAPDSGREVRPLEAIFIHSLPPWKRGLDIVGSIAGLLLLSPLLVAVALAVKTTSPGPVLFRQWRVGLGGRRFLIYKFRSMIADAEDRRSDLLELNERDGPVFKIQNDPRLTAIGGLLRRTAIDELPQLWNVLRGDMTLVGPRPLPTEEVLRYSLWQRQRLNLTPGMTCTWQVGRRTNVDFADWVRMDLQYGRTRSLFRDVKLLLQTVGAVLAQRGDT